MKINLSKLDSIDIIAICYMIISCSFVVYEIIKHIIDGNWIIVLAGCALAWVSVNAMDSMLKYFLRSGIISLDKKNGQKKNVDI